MKSYGMGHGLENIEKESVHKKKKFKRFKRFKHEPRKFSFRKKEHDNY